MIGALCVIAATVAFQYDGKNLTVAPFPGILADSKVIVVREECHANCESPMRTLMVCPHSDPDCNCPRVCVSAAYGFRTREGALRWLNSADPDSSRGVPPVLIEGGKVTVLERREESVVTKPCESQSAPRSWWETP